jgi:hypothetical protein
MTSFSSSGSTGGRRTGFVLAKAHFLAIRARNHRSRESGVTKVANCPRRRGPTSLALRRKSDSLGVGTATGFAAELFEQHVIFFLEIIDDVLLVPVHPAGHSDDEELEARGHGVENPSKSFAAQPSGWPRLSILVVHASIEKKRIVLVDTVFTTGATTGACAQTLISAGASEAAFGPLRPAFERRNPGGPPRTALASICRRTQGKHPPVNPQTTPPSFRDYRWLMKNRTHAAPCRTKTDRTIGTFPVVESDFDYMHLRGCSVQFPT